MNEFDLTAYQNEAVAAVQPKTTESSWLDNLLGGLP